MVEAAQKAQLQAVWAQVDVDGSGTLDKEELRVVLGRMGMAGMHGGNNLGRTLAAITGARSSSSATFDQFVRWFARQDKAAQVLDMPGPHCHPPQLLLLSTRLRQNESVRARPWGRTCSSPCTTGRTPVSSSRPRWPRCLT